MIFRKFEVVEHYLTRHAEASWGELLALTTLSAIKADILRPGRKEERELVKKMELARAEVKTVDRPAA